MLGTQYFQEEMLCSTNVARFRCILFDFHHGGRPFPLHSHNHVGVVAADITVEDAAVRIDEMVMMFQPEMLEDLVHWTRFVAIEFGALDRLEGANLFMISPMFVGHRLAAAFLGSSPGENNMDAVQHESNAVGHVSHQRQSYNLNSEAAMRQGELEN